MKKCEECSALVQHLSQYKSKKVCSDCLQRHANEKAVCPNCGYIIDEGESVGITLRSLDRSEMEKKAGIEALVIVCPRCKIVFFDDFQYNIIQGLRKG